jgi:diguanylate cyclase (GGDEF)-like protein
MGIIQDKRWYLLQLPFIRINPRIVMLVSTLAIITALMAIPAYVLATNHHQVVIEELQKRAEGLAAGVALMIQHEINQYRKLVDAADIAQLSSEEVDFYETMNAHLSQLTERTGAQFIFTERWIDHDTIAYVLDGTDPTSEDFSALGEQDGMEPIERSAFLERSTVSTDLINDPLWGRYITGFSPIIDQDTDELLGVAGVDFSAEYAHSLMRRMDWLIAGSFFLLILLISLGFYVLYILLSKTSMEDYLTKLHSRRFFSLSLKEEIRIARRTGRPLCVILIDIDWFKQVNDTMGHAAGDRVLVSVADVLLSHTRPSDTCARLGGDEFAIILPACSIDTCQLIASRIQRFAAQIESTPNSHISLSMGLVEYRQSMDEHTMMHIADEALYSSKSAGKGIITVHSNSQ